MKKSFFKRSTSALLAFLMCFTTLIGIGGVTAFAAGTESTAVMIGFPRNGDNNYNGTWGHGNMSFMNGWSSSATTYSLIYGVGSYTGNICYCIEPGTPLQTGNKLVDRDENYWDNYPSSYNHTISPDDIKLFVGRIMQYGYTGTISTDWRSQNSGGDTLAQARATQFLIWEAVVGERDENFNHVSPGGKNAILDQLSTNHPLYSQTMNYYNSIVSSVQNHTKVPSFMTKSTGSAQTIELDWNGSAYTTTLTDTNGVLGNFNFSCSQPDVTFSASGNQLTITAQTAPADGLQISAEKGNSQRKGIIAWTDGKYTPGSGVQDLVTYTQSVNDPVKGFVNVKVSFGSAKIVKTSEDGKVDNISFTITGNGVNQTVKTNSNGEMQIDNLKPGIYTVTELAVDKYEPQEVRRVTVVSGQVATVNFNNILKRGDSKVIKSSEDKLVEGVTFRLSGTSLSGIAVDEYAVTNADGVAEFKDVLISGSTPYTIEEVDTAIRYVVPEKQTAAVEWETVTTRTFNNILKKFTVTVTKSDAEKGLPQGDATLANAQYGIFKGETLIDSSYTDENGQFTTKEYICDADWTVREIAPSEGYLLDATVHKVGAEPELYTIEHNQTANDVNEQVIKGNISIIKHTDDGETQIETPEVGAEFAVYLKSSGSYDNANADERDYITCDENGFAQTKDMPYGVYTVHQTAGWEGRELMPDFDVFISQNGVTYRYLINNANFESYINIVKVDAETGKTIPYAGAGFQIYDPDGNLVTMTFTYPTVATIDTFYTDANGSLVTPEKLPYGKGYSLVEAQAPYGYVLDSTPVSFDVAEENSTEESGVTVIKVDKPNMAQKGTISIEKSGEVFFGVSVSGAEGEDTIYQPLYQLAGLPGAKYEIRAAEDIITPDGTLRASKGELVDTIITDSDGLAESKELYLGSYEVKEIEAPDGMVLNDEIHTVTLVYAGQNVAVTETGTSFVNDRQKVEISLEKAMETNKLFSIGNNGEVKNVTFGIFAADELVSTSGTSIPKDGLLEIVSPDENGKASFKTDLPIGSYYVKEIATDSHYILSDKAYPVVFDYAGQDTALVQLAVNDGKPIDNELKYGSVSGIKTDEDGKGLGGALIGLFKTNDSDFTTENAILTTTSNDDGSFSFADIPYGTWYIREIAQPTGFVLNDTVYDVTVDKDEQVIEISIENRLIRGNITLTKVDADYPENKLTGAEFEVYKDTNGNGKLDDGDELLGKLTETDTGIYTMNDLLYGKYLVKEAKAPDGFILDTGVYGVTIDTDGKTYSVENKAGVGFINDAQKGSLKIVKTSSDGKVEGFSFRVTGKNYDKTFVTDKKGEILIEGLRIGEYTVSEVNNSASASYVLPADKQATVQVGATTVIQMHNEFRDTPKTGDNSNPALWIALAGASVIGIAVCGIIGFKKKKKEDND
ncbi:MAG TPA: Cys-Gln thioester bond-forming surface protein [Clostridiales bacterium]|nr:Cys-Gln thioester bond-forming surface protein [Clostridiales bacterium]